MFDKSPGRRIIVSLKKEKMADKQVDEQKRTFDAETALTIVERAGAVARGRELRESLALLLRDAEQTRITTSQLVELARISGVVEYDIMKVLETLFLTPEQMRKDDERLVREVDLHIVGKVMARHIVSILSSETMDRFEASCMGSSGNFEYFKIERIRMRSKPQEAKKKNPSLIDRFFGKGKKIILLINPQKKELELR